MQVHRHGNTERSIDTETESDRAARGTSETQTSSAFPVFAVAVAPRHIVLAIPARAALMDQILSPRFDT